MLQHSRLNYLYTWDFSWWCLWFVATYSTAAGSGCCGSEPSGCHRGTVWSSSRCCSSKAGCSPRCGHSQRWSLWGTGAAMMRCPAASTPAGKSHWEGRMGGGEGKRGRDRRWEEQEERARCSRERREAEKLDSFHRFWCLSLEKSHLFFSVMLSCELFMNIVRLHLL